MNADDPYCLLVSFVAREGLDDELAEALADVDALIAAAPGCLLHAVHQDISNPRRFWIAERFESRMAHADAVGDSRVRSIAARIGELVDSPPTRVESRSLGLREARPRGPRRP